MADNSWPIFHFLDLINNGTLLIGDGYRAKNNELGGTGPIFLRSHHVKDSCIDFSGVDRFHAELDDVVAGKMSKAGDVIITTKGNSTGRVSYVAPNLPSFVYSPHLSFWRSLKPDILLPGYLRYWSRGKDFQQQLSGLSCSTDMAPYLSLADQKRLKIALPPIEEQRAIARILGSLDDKIEANRRMNETLEALARTLFKSWFVDFDPVRARAEGRAPAGMDAETAALFPDSFEESEGRMVPSGWRVGAVEELCLSIENGGTPKRMESKYWINGTIPWFKTGELTDGPMIESEEAITELGLVNSSCKLWNVGTILIALYASPTVGRLGILEMPATANQACSALIAKPEYGNLFLFYTLLFAREGLQNIAVGAAQQNISQQVIRRYSVIIPDAKIASKFHQMIQKIYQLKVSNQKQSSCLAFFRDILLLKLISGKVLLNSVKNPMDV